MPKKVTYSREHLEQYINSVFIETQYINLLGIPLPVDRNGSPLPLKLPLEKIFISIRAIDRSTNLRRQQDEHWDLEREVAQTNYRQLCNNLGQHLYESQFKPNGFQIPNQPTDPQVAIEKNKRLVILGAPGSGKSTLLRYIAHKHARKPNNLIPILLSLKEYATALDQDSSLSITEFALREVTRIHSEIRSQLELAIKNEEILWLLDGLDETYNQASIISRQVNFLPGKTVLTSRYYGYTNIGLEDIPHYEILPIIPEDVDKFFLHWFEVIADARSLDSEWVKEKLDWINNQLAGKTRIKSLLSNPLMLTFLAIICSSETNAEIPLRRSDIYKRYVIDLITTWEKEHNNNVTVSKDILLDGLFSIGWGLHFAYFGGKSQQLSTKEGIIKFLRMNNGKQWGEKTGEYIDNILTFWVNAGLIDTWELNGVEYLSFRHLTFQEYSAARVLADNWINNKRSIWKFLRSRLHNPAWHEVIILMGSILDSKQFGYLANQLLTYKSDYENILKRNTLLL